MTGAEPADRWSLTLYVNGASPRSIHAIENARRLCAEELDGEVDLEIIDVQQQPAAVVQDNILAAPTLGFRGRTTHGRGSRRLEVRELPAGHTAGDCVVLLVKEHRKGVNIEKVKAQNDKLQQIEGEADKLMLDLLRDLYNGDHSSMRVVIMKDLLEILEKVFDRCRDAGNVVFHIVLKHS